MNGSMELSLVLFTVVGQGAVGLIVMAALRQWSAVEGFTGRVRVEWIVAGLALLFALLASLFHLGHPFSAPRAISHLSTSWLSREVLSFLVFGALIVLVFFASLKPAGGRGALLKLTAAVGLAGVLVSSMVYSPPSFPALNNGAPTIFFVLTAFLLGAGFCSYFAGPERQGLLVRILLVSLIVGLVVNLLLPSLWLAGGRVMEMTGQAFYGSGLYWLRLAGEFGLGIAVVGALRKIPVWLPVVLLAGELLGRIMFFTHVLHAATNLGGLY